MPLVSVIVPVYNAARHLRECLDTVLRQTLTDFELIAVDDGSSDESSSILAEYAAADPRITIMPGPSSGSAGAARNTGLDVASGDYLSFLDADDFFAPTMLEELYSTAAEHSADVVLSKFKEYREDTRDSTVAEWSLRLGMLPSNRPFTPEQAGDYLFFAANPAAWNKLFRTAFVREQGLRFQHLQRTNDACFTYLALALARRITCVDLALVSYRTGDPTSLQSTADQSPLDFLDALEGLRTGLLRADRFTSLERAFVNLVLSMSLGCLRRARTVASFLEIRGALRDGGFARFGVLGRPSDYFLRTSLTDGLAQVLELSPEALLFTRMRTAIQAAERARAQSRRATREVEMRANCGWITRPAAALEGDPPATRTAPADPVAPDVSVIIPAHNTELWLPECLESVLRQTHTTVEVIGVDDGSPDGSGKLLDNGAARDDRIRVIHQPHSGRPVALNAGIELASGRYVCFVESDDYWRLDGLSDLVRQADEGELDVLLFDAVSVRQDGVGRKKGTAHRTYGPRGPYPGIRPGPAFVAELAANGDYRADACLALIRRDLVVRRGLRFYPGIVNEDGLFTFGLMLYAERVAHTQSALYAKRLRQQPIASSSSKLAAARGHLITCLEMLRSLGRRQFGDEKTAAAFGSLAHDAFWAARDASVGLPEELVERLGEVDADADAQALFQILRHSRIEMERLSSVEGRLQRVQRLSRTRGWLGSRPFAAAKPLAKRLLAGARRLLVRPRR